MLDNEGNVFFRPHFRFLLRRHFDSYRTKNREKIRIEINVRFCFRRKTIKRRFSMSKINWKRFSVFNLLLFHPRTIRSSLINEKMLLHQMDFIMKMASRGFTVLSFPSIEFIRHEVENHLFSFCLLTFIFSDHLIWAFYVRFPVSFSPLN